MNLVDWLILIIPTAIVMGVGVYSAKYVRSVADFLSAGRVAGRYVISVGDVANALSIIGLAAYVEVHYKTGFALVFWNNVLLPLGIIMGLFGYCTYRFRETKAMSLGQFLEMRYNRPFRIFASCFGEYTIPTAKINPLNVGHGGQSRPNCWGSHLNTVGATGSLHGGCSCTVLFISF